MNSTILTIKDPSILILLTKPTFCLLLLPPYAIFVCSSFANRSRAFSDVSRSGFQLSAHQQEEEKKRLENFKKSINTNMVAPSNEILSPSADETQSPITERKVKIKKEGGKPKKSKDGKPISGSKGGSKRSRGFHPYRDTIACCMTSACTPPRPSTHFILSNALPSTRMYTPRSHWPWYVICTREVQKSTLLYY